MNTPSPNCLRLVSYNCRGWRSGSDYVKLLQSCDLCFIQEHWLFCKHLSSTFQMMQIPKAVIVTVVMDIAVMRRPHCLVTKAFSATHQIILRPLIQMPVYVIPVATLLNTQSLSSTLVQPRVVSTKTSSVKL